MKRMFASLVCAILRHFPTDRIRWRFLAAGLRLCRGAFPVPSEKVFTTRHGFRMALDVGDWLGRHIYVTGDYEPDTTKVFRDHVRAGSTVVDVGANAGYYTCLAASLVGASGRVIGFEPTPGVHQRLRRNLELNGFHNVETHCVALSNHSGSATFNVGPLDHLGTSSMRTVADASGAIEVTVRRGDDLLHGLDRLDFLKVDVEGAECHVLEGLRAMIGRCLPDLVVEITADFLAAMNRRPSDIETLLAPFGYRFYLIGHRGLTRLPTLIGHDRPQFNVFATARIAGGAGSF